MKYDQNIPLCRSEFLQDFSIELGRRFNPSTQSWASFLAKVEPCEKNEQTLERLAMWAEDYYGVGTGLALWEDRTVWVCLFLCPTPNNPGYQISFYPACEEMTIANIAEAFRDTYSIATRLCYGDSPKTLLRRFWKHTGSFNTEGELPKGSKSEIVRLAKPKQKRKAR